MIQEIKNKTILNLILLVIQLLLSYIKYIFLTGSVIFSVTILLFIILSINPDVSFGWLKYFSFINPIYKAESFSLGIKEVMEIFSVVSLIVMVMSNLIKFALKKIFNVTLSLKLKYRILIFFIIITLAYIFASVIVGVGDDLDKGFYLIFEIFYIMNLVSATFYFLLDELLKTIFRVFSEKPQM